MKQDDTTARFDEQLLTAYFSGTATAEEEQALLAWIRSSDDNRRTFAELRAVWQRGRMQRPDTQLQARFVRSLNSLTRRIDALGADAPLRRSRRIQCLLRRQYGQRRRSRNLGSYAGFSRNDRRLRR